MTKLTSKSLSSYWTSNWNSNSIINYGLSTKKREALDLYQLAASKRAIGNFVSIVANENIPVTFSVRGESYTDGKQVVIGSNITNPDDFDIAVGLALHEGSHIKLSDFELLTKLNGLIPPSVSDTAVKIGVLNSISTIKTLWNVVEDRRIDAYIYKQAPGYRGYYKAMYNKYFNNPLIDKGLLSNEATTETIESYLFRIINIHNKNFRVDALKGLPEIVKILDLKNITRLKTTKDAFDIALSIFKVILKYLQNVDNDDNNGGDSDDTSSEDGNTNEAAGGDSDSNNSNNISTDNIDSGSTPTKSNSNAPELTDRQRELLKKKIKKQTDFLDGDIKKKKITADDNRDLSQIDSSGSSIQNVDFESSNGHISKVNCIVVKNMTAALLNSFIFPMTSLDYDTNTARHMYDKNVELGIKLGTTLGKKLQIRSESRTTIYNRQKLGKIDKRMIASLGFGNENVFEFADIDSYNKANLHISVDASSSMGGKKWTKTLTNVVALCKAADLIENLNIQVTFRTTNKGKPYIVLAYDSLVDKFSKVKQLFGALRPNGFTPEGLCFDAILKEFIASNINLDSYFLNISDGEPYFNGESVYYSGRAAEAHTRKMIKKIEAMGINILSYFVSSYDSILSDSFVRMYGKKASKLIDVTNISEISKTMNMLFLKK